ncbi:hypothetical protein B0H14DRAFT_3650636, partial [Mycena olivaceomarginata]
TFTHDLNLNCKVRRRVRAADPERVHDRGEEYTMSRGHLGTNELSGDGARVGRWRCMDPSRVGVAQCKAGGWGGAQRWCMGQWGVRRNRVEMPQASAGAAQAGSRADCTMECDRTEGVPAVGCVGAQWGMTQRQAGCGGDRGQMCHAPLQHQGGCSSGAVHCAARRWRVGVGTIREGGEREYICVLLRHLRLEHRTLVDVNATNLANPIICLRGGRMLAPPTLTPPGANTGGCCCACPSPLGFGAAAWGQCRPTCDPALAASVNEYAALVDGDEVLWVVRARVRVVRAPTAECGLLLLRGTAARLLLRELLLG